MRENREIMAVSKSGLKAHMLDYFRIVEETGAELVVASHRKPVVKVVRLEERKTVEEVFWEVRNRVRLDDAAVQKPETEEWGELP